MMKGGPDEGGPRINCIEYVDAFTLVVAAVVRSLVEVTRVTGTGLVAALGLVVGRALVGGAVLTGSVLAASGGLAGGTVLGRSLRRGMA